MKKILFFLIISIHVHAQIIVTDRPDQTESSSTIARGSVQIESGILISQNEILNQFNNPIIEKNIYLPSTLFRLGLTDKIELRIFNQYQYNYTEINSVNGFNDLELGFKVQLFQQEKNMTELAFLSHIAIPTAPSIFNENNDKYIGLINKLCVSHNLNNKIGIGYNLGYNYFDSGLSDYTYSFVVGFKLNERISAYVEPYGQISGFEDSEANINMGMTYLIKDNLQLDYSYGTGLNNISNFMSIGCSINIL